MSSSPSRPTPDQPTLTEIVEAGGVVKPRRSTLEEDLETMVAHGHCICFEMVNGVLHHSDWFIHPYCPQHGGPEWQALMT